nr:immunoglobulin heavy chain junction region [Macaca mulatta]
CAKVAYDSSLYW